MTTKHKAKKQAHLKAKTKTKKQARLMALRSGDPYPAAAFPEVGDAVTGRIVGRLNSALILETDPGEASSRVMLYITERDQRRAIAEAVRDAQREDLAIYDELAITFVGYDGESRAYRASHAPA